MMKEAEMLRQEIRYAETRIQEFCAKQVPAEIFHYTLSQMRTIKMLYALTRDLPNGVQLKMLAEKLGVTPAAASEMVDTLVRKGALCRRSDPSDRRAVLLQVGDDLRERFEKCEKKLCRITQDFLDSLSPEDVAAVLTISRKFSEFIAGNENFSEG